MDSCNHNQQHAPNTFGVIPRSDQMKRNTWTRFNRSEKHSAAGCCDRCNLASAWSFWSPNRWTGGLAYQSGCNSDCTWPSAPGARVISNRSSSSGNSCVTLKARDRC